MSGEPTGALAPLQREDVIRLPKAELHLHLEGAIRPSTAAGLAGQYGRPMPRTGRFRDLGDFVVAYEEARDLVGSLDDLRRISRELVEDAAAQGVVWSEVHLVPPTYAGRLGPDEAVLEAVLEGLAAGSSEVSSAGVIVGINRGLGLDAAERSMTLAKKYAGAGVVGLGLVGDEASHPAQLFTEVFAKAREAGLRSVPHGGEGAGPESVRACVQQLDARRVSHGVRAVEDQAVIDLLVERDVCLDVCPTSNVALSVSPSLEEHPLAVLVDSGVRVTLNSDCPLFVGTSVNDEYRSAHARMGLDLENLVEIAWNSLNVSSCPADRRDSALERISAWAASMGAVPLAGYQSGP